MLEAENIDLCEKLGNAEGGQELKSKLVELEEKVEERTNRQLKEKIVIKEHDETWERTTQILSQIFNESMDTIQSVEKAPNMIKRAHREKPND